MKGPAWSGEGSSLGLRLLIVPSYGRGARDHSGISFVGVLILLMRVPPSWPKYISKAPLSNTITSDIRISMCKFWVDTNIHNAYTRLCWQRLKMLSLVYSTFLVHSYTWIFLHSEKEEVCRCNSLILLGTKFSRNGCDLADFCLLEASNFHFMW